MTSPVEVQRFHPASLVGREHTGGGLTLVRVDPGAQVAAGYVSPGQYVEVRAGGETGYFVLANEPGSTTWDLIMRHGGGASDVLLAVAPGADVEVTAPIGEGFPMESARGRPLVVVLGGTGVAAARPVVRRRMADGDATRTEVLIGVRTMSEVSLTQDLDAWSESGVGVTVCLSQENQRGDSPRYAPGYVQDVLRWLAARNRRPVRGALLFAVGTDSMVEALRDLAPSLGIRREDVLTNH